MIRKKQLISLHGIRDPAHWQADLTRVFQAEFEHVPLRYREYHLFGAIKIFLWPWSLLSAGLSLVAIAGFHVPEVLSAAVILISCLMLGHEWTWSRWTAWLIVPCLIGVACALTYEFVGEYKIESLWLLFVACVFFQELRELQGDSGPAIHWWPFLAALFIGWGIVPLFWGGWIHGAIYVLASLLFGFWEADRRRNFAFEKVANSFQRRRQGARAHLVAHSFGTYIVSRLLRDRATFVRLDNLILFGAVVPEDYDWLSMLRPATPTAIRSVFQTRNEYGHGDWVVPLATFFPPWGRRNGLGRSGLVGFHAAPHVHTVAHAFGECTNCLRWNPDHWVHNVSISDYQHSNFLKPIHFRELWLPYLWGYVPHEYEDFLRLCHTVVENVDDAAHLALALDALLESEWVWSYQPAAGSFKDYLIQQIAKKTGIPPSNDEVVDAAFDVCLLVIEALDEFEKGNGAEEKVLRCLKPPRAVTAVVGR